MNSITWLAINEKETSQLVINMFNSQSFCFFFYCFLVCRQSTELNKYNRSWPIKFPDIALNIN